MLWWCGGRFGLSEPLYLVLCLLCFSPLHFGPSSSDVGVVALRSGYLVTGGLTSRLPGRLRLSTTSPSQWLPGHWYDVSFVVATGHWRFDLATTWSLEALELVVSFAVATWSLAVLPRDFLVA